MTTWKWRNQSKTKTKRLALPSQYQLRFYYEYDPETGIFSKNGKEVGWIDEGYVKTKIDNIKYSIHRLIWKYMTDEEPEIIDHINRIKSDNRWCNLRKVSPKDSARNVNCRRRDSVSGVYYRPERGKWEVTITCDKKSIHIGTYQHPLEAIQARIEAEEIFWGKSHVHTNLK